MARERGWVGRWWPRSRGPRRSFFYAAHIRAGQSPPFAAWVVVGYLTDWSNLAIALVGTAVALGSARLTGPFARTLATVAIVLVGTLYAALGGWHGVLHHGASNLLAHIASPIGAALVWLLVWPHGGTRWRDVPRFLLLPAAYLAQMLARGLAGGGWPYSEVDLPRVGWSGVATLSALVLGLYLLAGAALVGLDRRLGGERANALGHGALEA